MPPPFTTDQAGCWLWNGALSTKGYGWWNLAGQPQSAHKAMYELLMERVPLGCELHHSCQVRRCANPDHLLVVTPAEHARLHLKPACGKGHPFTSDNTYVAPDGKRECRVCRHGHMIARCLRQRNAQTTKET